MYESIPLNWQQHHKHKHKTMETNNYKHYLAPEFEVITIDVEQGFALSNLENPVEKPEMNW